MTKEFSDKIAIKVFMNSQTFQTNIFSNTYKHLQKLSRHE